ncbi:DNA glycosylase AlkZ-like family protein [Nonomuraea polychroma]|uniref:DNA glycosylase AlkZ-like family protein n=1 Tax=Nonomuraea polychroma TaxID=46176 RepID=UPI003D93DBE3
MNRLAGFDPAGLDVAFRDQALVKATLMRITLHVVHADDHPVMHAAMQPTLRAARLGDRRFTGSGLSDRRRRRTRAAPAGVHRSASYGGRDRGVAVRAGGAPAERRVVGVAIVLSAAARPLRWRTWRSSPWSSGPGCGRPLMRSPACWSGWKDRAARAGRELALPSVLVLLVRTGAVAAIAVVAGRPAERRCGRTADYRGVRDDEWRLVITTPLLKD